MIAKRSLKMCSLVILLSLPVFLAACGGSSSSGGVNISGSWFIYNATNGVAGEEGPGRFIFAINGNHIGATASQGESVTGTIDGENVSFSWVASDGATYTYTGTAVDNNGKTMSGTWSNSKGQSGTWLGLFDAIPSFDIKGNWSFTNAGPEATISISITESGSGITITTPQGEQSPPGAFSGRNVAFFVNGSDGATYAYSGSVNSDANAMSGTWTNTNGQSGTWSATRT